MCEPPPAVWTRAYYSCEEVDKLRKKKARTLRVNTCVGLTSEAENRRSFLLEGDGVGPEVAA